MTNEKDANLAARPSVHIEKRNAVAIVTLDRPQVLNALDGDMREIIAAALPTFPRDPVIYAVVLRSACPKAFCAGGDVRRIVEIYREDPASARREFAEEYRLDWALECFARPTVSLIDGLVMGSGVGLTAYNTHRVAGETYKFAMPETAIGLFPDVGAAHVLANMPHEIGLYLGLTGRAIGRADAYALDLVTHCVPARRFEEVIDALADAWPVDPVLDERHEDPGTSELLSRAEVISRCFSAPTVAEILDRLSLVAGRDAEWAAGVKADLLSRAPLSLEVTLRHIRLARSDDIRDTLIRDYRLACRFLDGHDFAEGVRAMLVDKDKSPAWRPASLAEVDPAEVDRYFATLADGELDLSSRAEMQQVPA